MPSHNERVSRALRGHRAVTRKISRIKSGNHTEVSGSKYDPRQSPDWIRNATDKQLSSLIRRQDKFLDRSVQFVPDAQLKPLPMKLWQTFQAAEAKKNEFVEKFYEPFKNVHIDPAGMSVDDRMRIITPLHAHMGERTSDNPYKKHQKASTSVYGEAGLKALIKDMRKKSTKTHEKESLDNHRAGLLKMLDAVGNEAMAQKVSKMTAKQWALVWKYTQFARNIRPAYQHYKDSMAGRKGVANSQMVETDLQIADEYLDWAGKQFRTESDWKNDPALYGEDKFIRKLKGQAFEAEMNKRGYRKVGNQFFKAP